MLHRRILSPGDTTVDTSSFSDKMFDVGATLKPCRSAQGLVVCYVPYGQARNEGPKSRPGLVRLPNKQAWLSVQYYGVHTIRTQNGRR